MRRRAVYAKSSVLHEMNMIVSRCTLPKILHAVTNDGYADDVSLWISRENSKVHHNSISENLRLDG